HLIGDISHDVKNFLTPVLMASETLEAQIQDALVALDRAAEAMSDADGKRIAAAVAELRGFHAEASDMVRDGAHDVQEQVRAIADAIKGIIAEPRFETVSFPDCAEAVAAVLKHNAGRRGVSLYLSGVGDEMAIEADYRRLYNALYNLVNNAIAETPPGGAIAIRSRSVPLNGE